MKNRIKILLLICLVSVFFAGCSKSEQKKSEQEHVESTLDSGTPEENSEVEDGTEKPGGSEQQEGGAEEEFEETELDL